MTQPTAQLIDLRGLAGSQEVTVYQNGGLFPVLAVLPENQILGVLRGGAGHLGLTGRIDLVRSADQGRTWMPAAVIADSDLDDRNPALGVSLQGTVLLAYHRTGNYTPDEQYNPGAFAARGERPVEVMLTRSVDGGLTWEQPYPLDLPVLSTGSPYGKIVTLADGTLGMALYGPVDPTLVPDVPPGTDPLCSYLLRSYDDGRTWGEPSLIGAGYNETGLLVLPDGTILAAMRGNAPDDRLVLTRSTDGGQSWSTPQTLTEPRQHPADLVQLSDGTILLTYGNRTPPYRVEGRVSRNGGHTWLPMLLTLSGHLYGYTITEPRRTDLGYPSSVVLPDGTGVTVYYYTPALFQTGRDRLTRPGPQYTSDSYRAIGVLWSEAALLEALAAIQ